MEADDCAFVIYGTDGSQLNYTCIPKNGNQYQVRSAYLSSNIKGAFKDSLYVCCVENKAGHSQLITVSQGNLREPDGKKTVSDSLGNTFSYVIRKLCKTFALVMILYLGLSEQEINMIMSRPAFLV